MPVNLPIAYHRVCESHGRCCAHLKWYILGIQLLQVVSQLRASVYK